MKKSFKLIVISPEDFKKNEIPNVIELFSKGLSLFHLRKPSASKNKIEAYLNQIPEKFHNRIVLHSHYKLTEIFHLKGIHLPEKIRKKYLGREIKKERILSTSFHNIPDMLRSRRKYEYVFLSPVFDSISKKGYKSSFTKEELKPVLQKRKNIIALGGITEKNITEIKQLGFSGAAILGYVWEAKDPVANFKKLRSKI